MTLDKQGVFDNTLEGNKVNRDLQLASTINNYNSHTDNPLKRLIELTKLMSEEDPDYKEIFEELTGFLDKRNSRETIGLEEKLRIGGREDLLEDALYLESKFARRVAKREFSKTDCVIYTHCLSSIKSDFESHIKHLIMSSADNATVDKEIMVKIIEPLYNMTSEVKGSITKEVIKSMVFFLTGKCFLKWS